MFTVAAFNAAFFLMTFLQITLWDVCFKKASLSVFNVCGRDFGSAFQAS